MRGVTSRFDEAAGQFGTWTQKPRKLGRPISTDGCTDAIALLIGQRPTVMALLPVSLNLGKDFVLVFAPSFPFAVAIRRVRTGETPAVFVVDDNRHEAPSGLRFGPAAARCPGPSLPPSGCIIGES